jgi:hypothetical protein
MTSRTKGENKGERQSGVDRDTLLSEARGQQFHRHECQAGKRDKNVHEKKIRKERTHQVLT